MARAIKVPTLGFRSTGICCFTPIRTTKGVALEKDGCPLRERVWHPDTFNDTYHSSSADTINAGPSIPLSIPVYPIP